MKNKIETENKMEINGFSELEQAEEDLFKDSISNLFDTFKNIDYENTFFALPIFISIMYDRITIHHNDKHSLTPKISIEKVMEKLTETVIKNRSVINCQKD